MRLRLGLKQLREHKFHAFTMQPVEVMNDVWVFTDLSRYSVKIS